MGLDNNVTSYTFPVGTMKTLWAKASSFFIPWIGLRSSEMFSTSQVANKFGNNKKKP